MKELRDIILVGGTGTKGALKLIKENYDRLRETLSDRFLKEAEIKLEESFERAGIAFEDTSFEVGCVRKLDRFGIYGGLYELGEERNVGVTVDIKDIPISQEIIEICEVLQVNPYTMDSEPAFLAAVKDGHRVVYELRQKGYEASFIGIETDLKKRVVKYPDNERFLTPVARESYFEEGKI